MTAWRAISETPFSYLNLLNEAAERVQQGNPNFLTPVRDGTQVIASDYSGQHRGAAFEAYSFVVTTEAALVQWAEQRNLFRARWLPDGRRLSFKQLSEPLRRRALLPFLQAAGTLRGNLVTVLVGANVGSWIQGGPAALMAELPECFHPETPLGTVEKMLRLASLVALLAAALRNEDQPSRWVSDDDETLATFERREGFAKLSSYLTFALTGWRSPADQLFFTTGSAKVPEWTEDLLAVADLAAGAYSKGAGVLPTFLGRPTWTTRTSSERLIDERARAVLDWLATGGGVLRHLLFRLERDRHGEVRASAQTFLRRENLGLAG